MLSPRRLRRSALIAAFASLAACSEPPPPKSPVAGPKASLAAEPAKPAANLAPVPAPLGLVGHARLRNVTATMKLLATIGKGEPDRVEEATRALLAEAVGRRGMRLEVDARALGEQLVTSAPVDVALVVGSGGAAGPDIKLAYSIGLSSFEAARKAAGEKAVPVGDDAWQLGGDKARGSCVITRSAGLTEARLVCSPMKDGAAPLAAYLARTVAVEPMPAADATATIDVAAIDAAVGPDLRKLVPALPLLAKQQLGMGNEAFDAAVAEGAKLVGREGGALLGDLDKITLDANVDPRGSIEVALDVKLRGEQSEVAKVLTGAPGTTAPSIAWRGPKDATSVGYLTIARPELVKEITRVLGGLALGMLGEQRVGSEAERRQLVKLLEFPLRAGMPVATFSGHARLTPRAAGANAKDKWQRGLDALTGWSMVYVGEPVDALTKWLDDAVAALAQPGIKNALAAGGSMEVVARRAKDPKALGKGARAYELVLTNTKEKSGGVVTVFVVPEGEGAWLAYGYDAAELGERLLRARDGRESLKDRADLAPLQGGLGHAAYVFSTRSFLAGNAGLGMALGGGAQAKEPVDALLGLTAKLEELLASLPHKGEAAGRLVVTSPVPRAVAVRLTLPKDLLDDLAVAGQAGGPLGKPGKTTGPKAPPPAAESALPTPPPAPTTPPTARPPAPRPPGSDWSGARN